MKFNIFHWTHYFEMTVKEMIGGAPTNTNCRDVQEIRVTVGHNMLFFFLFIHIVDFKEGQKSLGSGAALLLPCYKHTR